VHATHGASPEEYEKQLEAVLSVGPNIIIDDGGELVELMRTKFADLLPGVIGGCEETTTGIIRLKKLHRDGILPFTMMMVNDADCKHLFDNRYGTGQSVWDGIMRTTNLIVASKRVVVSGYGWCGKGVAMRAAGLAFEGRHDFRAVRSVGTQTKTTVRTVHWCRARREGDMISVAVCADGFLYNMVRAIVGTMVYASHGKLEPEDIPHLLETGDRRLTGPTMPPQGLYLRRVWYEGEVGEMMREDYPEEA